MELVTWINAILGAFALVSAGMAALLFGSLKALRDSNQDLRDRDSDREIKTAALAAKVAELETARDVLASQVRGDDKFRSIDSKLEVFVSQLKAHHGESMEHLAILEALARAIVDELSGRGS